ncbi:hypothetical protein R3P38DRAFT_3373467 [Favolaschia claudopus]|uniref:Uncharacterized protein n=1 Tax=Favolaschia claudopus TaxID=2862362 RepID=A0AAV9ZS15_9AGAR
MPSPYPWWPEQEIDQRIIRESLLPPGNTPSGLSAGSYKSQGDSQSYSGWLETYRDRQTPVLIRAYSRALAQYRVYHRVVLPGDVISVPERRKKEEGERRLRMSGNCQPTREEHKEGRQQGRLEPAGWWKPIRNKTKAGLGRAGARPDEGGHVIEPDEGPGESEEPGELGKVGQSTGRLARKPRDEQGSRSRLDKVEQVQICCQEDKSGREGDEREEIQTVQQNKR